MSLPPKAPPVYKPTPLRLAAPPVYRTNQVNAPSAQLKPAKPFKLETRPAPPVYRPQQGTDSRVQLKSTGNFRVETRPAPLVYRPQPPQSGLQLKPIANFSPDTRSAAPVERKQPTARSAASYGLKSRDPNPSSQPLLKREPREIAQGVTERPPIRVNIRPVARVTPVDLHLYTHTIQRMEVEEMEDDPKVDGKKAARMVVKFIYEEKGTTDNWTAAVLDNGDLIIGKVNGVTSATGFTQNLREFISGKSIEDGRDIYLAGTFNSVSSRHAEMCILAAADALGKDITYMLCVAPNCDFCAKMLSDAGVSSAHYQGSDPTSQQGWTHPRKKVGYGTQLPASLKAQLTELGQLNSGEIGEDDITKGQKLGVAPKGKSEKWM